MAVRRAIQRIALPANGIKNGIARLLAGTLSRVPYGHKPFGISRKRMEAPPGFEPGMEVLQCSAPRVDTGKHACFIEVFAL